MKIIFEDGKLNANIVERHGSKYAIIDAANGVSYCKQCLDSAMADHQTTYVYTNSILALDNKYVWNDDLNVPELFIRVSVDYAMKFKWTHKYNFTYCYERIDKLTDRRLKESHNLMKLYLAGEFNSNNK